MPQRPYVQQLHQSGATDGQIVTWSSSLGYWIPETPAPVAFGRSSTVAVGGEAVIYLGGTPITDSDQVFLDGVLLTWGVDYTIAGSVIALTAPLTAGERITVFYVTTGTAGTPVLAPRLPGFTRPVSVTRPVRRFHRIR